MLQNIGAEIFPVRDSDAEAINEKFARVGELLDARRADLFERDPRAILESFLVMQQHSELKGHDGQDAARPVGARASASTPRTGAIRATGRTFLSLLPAAPRHRARAAAHESVRDSREIPAGVPAHRRAMQHDLFHVYTVDQHILTVLRNLRRFTMLEFSHEYPLCSRLIAGLDRHWLLYIAAIFHDIAKGRGGDHSQLGKVEARRFCREHGLSAEDTDLVVFLVEHHLTMSSVAQKQDLSDPEVGPAFR